ncbi:hypothetical protein [Ramlibacter sp. Leaf400]|uniref:hypothetical protein n=1 Tax=Ramlibacter sp. Leaf400 TaxID=1736365 RepID=UPI0006FD885F|nr:hypothetical protein [Ramlibacter sp. Leaf400]
MPHHDMLDKGFAREVGLIPVPRDPLEALVKVVRPARPVESCDQPPGQLGAGVHVALHGMHAHGIEIVEGNRRAIVHSVSRRSGRSGRRVRRHVRP